MNQDQENIIIGGFLLISWFLISQFLGEWITENYYIIGVISLLLIFGLIYEVWTSTGGEEDILDFLIVAGDEINRTTSQILLLFGVSSLVLNSILLRNYIESQFGPLAVVQLLAVVAVISRMFVNVRATSHPMEILDGTRETYLVYGTGLLAIILSYYLRDLYHPSTSTHNGMVIFFSTVAPAVFLYVFTDEEDLPSLRDIGNQIP